MFGGVVSGAAGLAGAGSLFGGGGGRSTHSGKKFSRKESRRFERKILNDPFIREGQQALLSLLSGEESPWMSVLKEQASSTVGNIRRGAENTSQSVYSNLAGRGGGFLADVLGGISAGAELQTGGLMSKAKTEGAAMTTNLANTLLNNAMQKWGLIGGTVIPMIGGGMQMSTSTIGSETQKDVAFMNMLGSMMQSAVGGFTGGGG